MAESIFSKVMLLVKASAHGILDKVIDLNSPECIKQYIRDLEVSIDQLRAAAAESEGLMNVSQGSLDAIIAEIESKQASIDLLLTDGDDSNDHLALPMQTAILDLEERKKMAEQTVEQHKQAMNSVDDVIAKLTAKHASMRSQLDVITTQLKVAASADKAAEAIKAAGKMDAPSIDNLVDRAATKGAIANANLRRAMEGLNGKDGGNNAALAQAQAALAARKAALAKK